MVWTVWKQVARVLNSTGTAGVNRGRKPGRKGKGCGILPVNDCVASKEERIERRRRRRRGEGEAGRRRSEEKSPQPRPNPKRSGTHSLSCS